MEVVVLHICLRVPVHWEFFAPPIDLCWCMSLLATCSCPVCYARALGSEQGHLSAASCYCMRARIPYHMLTQSWRVDFGSLKPTFMLCLGRWSLNISEAPLLPELNELGEECVCAEGVCEWRLGPLFTCSASFLPLWARRGSFYFPFHDWGFSHITSFFQNQA